MTEGTWKCPKPTMNDMTVQTFESLLAQFWAAISCVSDTVMYWHFSEVLKEVLLIEWPTLMLVLNWLLPLICSPVFVFLQLNDCLKIPQRLINNTWPESIRFHFTVEVLSALRLSHVRNGFHSLCVGLIARLCNLAVDEVVPDSSLRRR